MLHHVSLKNVSFYLKQPDTVLQVFPPRLVGLNQRSRAQLFVTLPKQLIVNCSICLHLVSQEQSSPQSEDYWNRKYHCDLMMI